MVQAVELVLDDDLDALVREEWRLLVDAGLPSQGRHTGASNAPHVTIGVAGALDDHAERALDAAVLGRGSPLRLGGLLVFSGRTAVLSRIVVPSSALLAAHAAVDLALDGMPDRPGTMAPGSWTPHVTLARRLDAEQLASALAVLADRPRELVGSIRCARRWDGEARVAWELPRNA